MTALRNAEICHRDFKSTTFATSFIFLIVVLVYIHNHTHQSCTGKKPFKKGGVKGRKNLKVSPFRTSEACYCWWLKSQTTTWDVWNPINNGKNYQPQLVSLPDFRDPSTVSIGNSRLHENFGASSWGVKVGSDDQDLHSRRWRWLDDFFFREGDFFLCFWCIGWVLQIYCKYCVYQSTQLPRLASPHWERTPLEMSRCQCPLKLQRFLFFLLGSGKMKFLWTRTASSFCLCHLLYNAFLFFLFLGRMAR